VSAETKVSGELCGDASDARALAWALAWMNMSCAKKEARPSACAAVRACCCEPWSEAAGGEGLEGGGHLRSGEASGSGDLLPGLGWSAEGLAGNTARPFPRGSTKWISSVGGVLTGRLEDEPVTS
jgi:hypothetical protein